MSSLYRPEAVAHKRNRLYGEIVIKGRPDHSIIAFVLIGISFAMLTFAIITEYSRIEIVPGMVISDPPVTKIYAQKAGVIKKITATEGALVHPGQHLATVSLDYVSGAGVQTISSGMDALDQQISIVKSQLEINDRAIVQDKWRIKESIEQAKQEEQSLIDQIQLQREVLESAEKMFNAYSRVVDSGHVSKLEYERCRQAYLQEGQRLNQLEQQLSQNRGQRKILVRQLDKVSTDGSKHAAEVNANLKSLELSRTKLRGDVDYKIASPIKGRVMSINGSLGKTVDSRYPLMVIVPEDTIFHAEAYVPTRAAGFLKNGLNVRIMFDAFPYEKFGSFNGRIESISRSILGTNEIETPIKLEDPVYKIRIKLEDSRTTRFGESLGLQSGMTLKAAIILERRTFIERLLEPVYIARKRL